MSQSAPKFPRRQLLSQGMNISLGMMFLPQMLSGESQPRIRQSLIALASTADGGNNSEAVRQDPITVAIHLKAKKGKIEALTTHLIQILSDARQAPGCRYAQIYVIADHPNQIVLFKGWDSQNDQTTYLRNEESSGRLAKLLALVESEPMVEHWEFQQN